LHDPTAEPSLYAEPPAKTPALEECVFYHSIELPGLGLQRGQWDLRPGIDAYLGPTDFDGLRVLEIGAANGFVTFELERRGAEVVTVDLPDTARYDARPSLLETQDMGAGLRLVRNALWLGHALTESSAKVVYAHVSELPDEIGQFDVAVVANVLQHLRDPLGALTNVARRADAIVVIESDWMAGLYDDVPCMVLFQGSTPYSWFQVKPPLIRAFLDELGYADQAVTRHDQLYVEAVDYSSAVPRRVETGGDLVPHFTITANRRAGRRAS
jgi:SAM-dependent methyltransferase